MYPRFGEDINPLRAIFDLALNTRTSLRGYKLDIVLRELYETTYDLTDLDNDLEPLAIIKYNDAKEGLWELGPRATLMREFSIYNVKEHFGLSWLEFIQLQRHECSFMIDHLRKEEARIRAMAKNAEGNLDAGQMPSAWK